MSADFYDLLGVDEDADTDELKRAYRNAVRRYHPDVNDSDNADAQFKVVKSAYETLSDPKERARYDRLGHRSYVRDHLGGLPTTVVSTVDSDGSGPGEVASGGRTSDSDGSKGRWGGRTSRSSRSTESTAESNRSTASRSATSGSTTSGSTRSGSTAGGSTTSGSTDARATSSASRSSSRGAGAGERTGRTETAAGSRATATSSGSTTHRRNSADVGDGRANGHANATDATSAAAGPGTQRTTAGRAAGATGTSDGSNASAASRDAASHVDPHRVGLQRGLYASIVGLVAYLVGLFVYFLANAGTVAALADGATAAPWATLASEPGLADPIAYLLAASADLGTGLAFGVGLVALPLTVGATVLRFGRGTARLYAIATLSPVAWIVLASALPFAAAGVAPPAALAGGLPVGLTALLLVAIPVGATVAFVVDVARYLEAG